MVIVYARQQHPCALYLIGYVAVFVLHAPDVRGYFVGDIYVAVCVKAKFHFKVYQLQA